MRNSDISIKDEWKVLRDAQDFPYYYNPYSMQMSWNPPQTCKMCDNLSVVHTWWKLYPTPQGPCEYLADPDNCTDKQSGLVYCKRCWKFNNHGFENRHNGLE